MKFSGLFENSKYKVAGSFAYKGDLIITKGVIYYFPHTDLVQKRINTVVSTMAVVAGPYGVASSMIRNLALPDSTDRDSQMFTATTHETIQNRLDESIKQMKEDRSSVTLSTALPLPMRFSQADIQNMTISFLGLLKFDAHFDTHVFSAGFASRSKLRGGLIENGFIS